MPTQTLLEYLRPVRAGSRRAVCLAALKWLQDEDGRESASATEVKNALISARVPKAKTFNVADVMGKAGHLVTSPGRSESKAIMWSLTTSGYEWVNEQLGPEAAPAAVVNSVSGLTTLASNITDEVIKGYVEESLLCYRVGALRASVVFLWSGAIRHLQDRAWAMGVANLNAALIKHDPKAKHVTKIEDFSAVKDVTQLLGFRELGSSIRASGRRSRRGSTCAIGVVTRPSTGRALTKSRPTSRTWWALRSRPGLALILVNP